MQPKKIDDSQPYKYIIDTHISHDIDWSAYMWATGQLGRINEYTKASFFSEDKFMPLYESLCDITVNDKIYQKMASNDTIAPDCIMEIIY